MKRALIIASVVVIAAAGIWSLRIWTAQLQNAQSADARATADAKSTMGQAPEDVIWASGKLLPMRWAGLSPAASGTVRAVHVAEGDRVEAGALLLELDNAILQRQVDAAAAAVSEAEAARAKLLAGATTQQLAQAQAEMATAEANVDVAQAAVKQAQEAAAAAESQVLIAQAQADELASRPSEAEKVAALRLVDMETVAVRQAQSAYDRIKGMADIGARPESLALEQATLQLQSAKAAYFAAAQGATPQQLAVAQAQMKAAQSQAQVAASQVPSEEAAVRAAKAQLSRVQAALDALKAGASEAEKAMADSHVKMAQAQMAAVQAQLSQTRIIAPFAGQIGSVLVRPGELAVPGQAVLILGDTSRFRVETTDLRETDVTRLKRNQPVEVTFDALPGRTFEGQIARIAPMSSAEKGSTNYTVIVELAELDEALRWGMTAFVNVQAQ